MIRPLLGLEIHGQSVECGWMLQIDRPPHALAPSILVAERALTVVKLLNLVLLALHDGHAEVLLVLGFADEEVLSGAADLGAEVDLGSVVNVVPGHAAVLVDDEGEGRGRVKIPKRVLRYLEI